MGRKSRNTAKTGDVAIYKSRDDAVSSSSKQKDDDNMYNEVERYHNAKDGLQDDMLKFDNANDDDSENDIDQQENVFDLGLDESDDNDSDDSGDSSDESSVEKKRALDQQGDGSDDTSDESDEEDDDDDDSSTDMEEPETDVMNWGKRKRDYYHGDTADLELGQEVEDAELEEEAGREVLKTRMEGMAEEDFMLDDDDDDEGESEGESESDEKQTKDGKLTTLATAMTTTMQKNLSRLSKKEKIKLMQKNHPELLPLVTHFREEFIRPCADETLVVANAMFQNNNNAEAVGATKEGLKYLITKAMIETSTALNVCQYLMIKAENADTSSKDKTDDNDDETHHNSNLIDDQEEDDIRNHPVINRLNQLNQLKDKLHSGIESKVPGLKDQVENLVKASSLMIGDDGNDFSDNEACDDGKEDEGQTSSLDELDEKEEIDDASLTASSSDEEDENATQLHRNVMNEARFALRAQDDMYKSDEEETVGKGKTHSSKRRRRAMTSTSDYGDEDAVDEAELNKAARSLASTVNTISQKNKKSNKSISAEGEDENNEERFNRGLDMMEAELGEDKNLDMDDMGDDVDIDMDDDDDDFYSQIKKKSKAKKEHKKSLYAVAPKYPGMENEIEGERSVGQVIMRNRGLIAHKAKINRNPRVKKREQYRKAIIRRKGAVRDVRTDEGHKYGGEETGIKSGLSRSRKL